MDEAALATQTGTPSIPRNAAILAVGLVLLSGCAATRPPRPGAIQAEGVAPFTHEAMNRVHSTFVDDRGRVDYPALVAAPDDLESYYADIAAVSPDSAPERFPTEQHELAYWINAYNAAAMRIVVDHYPITSVADVPNPFFFAAFSDKAGFFFAQRPTFGGRAQSLYTLENFLIRWRYDEPRIHFALNCASRGCPRLPMAAFTPDDLDHELDREARLFFSEPRNLEIDHEEQTITLSSILDWYEGDFTSWYERRYPGTDAELIDYVRLYVTDERRAELDRTADYEIRFRTYDWGLNDQHAPET